MMAQLHAMPGNEAAAERLAALLGIPCQPVGLRRFPDGESLVTVGPAGATALLYAALDQPDAKLMPLLLAASALRDRFARRVVLIAPYLAYMRQDQAFAPGEAVSQKVMGRLIASAFDALVTVDPHLHRTPRLADVAPGITAVAVAAAETLSRALAATVSAGTLLVGPDGESRPWVEAVAAPLGLEVMIGSKVREGDRAVAIALPEVQRAAGRPVILVDDLISSGGTLIACAGQLLAAGATRVSAVATHCLASPADLAALAAHGIAGVTATDTVPGPAATIPIAPALAAALRTHGLVA